MKPFSETDLKCAIQYAKKQGVEYPKFLTMTKHAYFRIRHKRFIKDEQGNNVCVIFRG